MGAAWWPDPRPLVPARAAEEYAALLDSLYALGPRDIPNRRRAAALAGQSEATFKRRFLLVGGMTWRAFVTEWRMQCGRERLRATYLLTKQVARDCGYRSEQGFARAYHARFGEFPRRRGPAPD